MWHSKASARKKHFILIHSEFKKTVVAVRSIGAGVFEWEGKGSEEKKQTEGRRK